MQFVSDINRAEEKMKREKIVKVLVYKRDSYQQLVQFEGELYQTNNKTEAYEKVYQLTEIFRKIVKQSKCIQLVIQIVTFKLFLFEDIRNYQ